MTGCPATQMPRRTSEVQRPIFPAGRAFQYYSSSWKNFCSTRYCLGTQIPENGLCVNSLSHVIAFHAFLYENSRLGGNTFATLPIFTICHFVICSVGVHLRAGWHTFGPTVAALGIDFLALGMSFLPLNMCADELVSEGSWFVSLRDS